MSGAGSRLACRQQGPPQRLLILVRANAYVQELTLKAPCSGLTAAVVPRLGLEVAAVPGCSAVAPGCSAAVLGCSTVVSMSDNGAVVPGCSAAVPGCSAVPSGCSAVVPCCRAAVPAPNKGQEKERMGAMSTCRKEAERKHACPTD